VPVNPLMAPHAFPPLEPLPDVPPDDDEEDVGAVGEDELLLLPPHAPTATTQAQVSATKATRRLDDAFIRQLAFPSVPARAGGGSTAMVQAHSTPES